MLKLYENYVNNESIDKTGKRFGCRCNTKFKKSTFTLILPKSQNINTYFIIQLYITFF